MIGRATPRLWAYFIDGGTGIVCDNVHCRYFTGAAVGMSARRDALQPHQASQLTDLSSPLKLAKAY